MAPPNSAILLITSPDRQGLADWYRDNLGIDLDTDWMGTIFKWSDQAGAESASTVWSIFAGDTEYFGQPENRFMINFRVIDLEAMLAQLRAAGCDVDDKLEDTEYGKFGWVTDPEGNRVELWQPPG